VAVPRVILRKAVPDDLLEILNYLDERSAGAADRFRVAVRATMEELARHPGMGSPKAFRAAALAGIRSWHVKGFRDILILYKPLDNGIEVWGVMHGSRDIGRMLRKRRPR
jgi:toxin ParE1/3/4